MLATIGARLHQCNLGFSLLGASHSLAYVGNDWGTFTSMQSWLLAAGSIAFAGVTNRMYWAKDPLPY